MKNPFKKAANLFFDDLYGEQAHKNAAKKRFVNTYRGSITGNIDLRENIYGEIDENLRQIYENFLQDLDNNILAQFKPAYPSAEISEIKEQFPAKERWTKALRNESLALLYYFETNNYEVLKSAMIELKSAMIDYFKVKLRTWDIRQNFLEYDWNVTQPYQPRFNDNYDPGKGKDLRWMQLPWHINHFAHDGGFAGYVSVEDGIIEAILDDYYNGRRNYWLFIDYWIKPAKTEFNTEFPVLMSANNAMIEDFTDALRRLYHHHIYAFSKEVAEFRRGSNFSEVILDSFDSDEFDLPKITRRYIHKNLHKGKGKSKSLNHRNQSIEKIAPDVLGYKWREGPYKLKSHDGYKEFYEKHNPNVDRYRYYFYFPIVYSDCSLSGYFDPKEIPATLLPNERM